MSVSWHQVGMLCRMDSDELYTFLSGVRTPQAAWDVIIGISDHDLLKDVFVYFFENIHEQPGGKKSRFLPMGTGHCLLHMALLDHDPDFLRSVIASLVNAECVTVEQILFQYLKDHFRSEKHQEMTKTIVATGLMRDYSQAGMAEEIFGFRGNDKDIKILSVLGFQIHVEFTVAFDLLSIRVGQNDWQNEDKWKDLMTLVFTVLQGGVEGGLKINFAHEDRHDRHGLCRSARVAIHVALENKHDEDTFNLAAQVLVASGIFRKITLFTAVSSSIHCFSDENTEAVKTLIDAFLFDIRAGSLEFFDTVTQLLKFDGKNKTLCLCFSHPVWTYLVEKKGLRLSHPERRPPLVWSFLKRLSDMPRGSTRAFRMDLIDTAEFLIRKSTVEMLMYVDNATNATCFSLACSLECPYLCVAISKAVLTKTYSIIPKEVEDEVKEAEAKKEAYLYYAMDSCFYFTKWLFENDKEANEGGSDLELALHQLQKSKELCTTRGGRYEERKKKLMRYLNAQEFETCYRAVDYLFDMAKESVYPLEWLAVIDTLGLIEVDKYAAPWSKELKSREAKNWLRAQIKKTQAFRFMAKKKAFMAFFEFSERESKRMFFSSNERVRRALFDIDSGEMIDFCAGDEEKEECGGGLFFCLKAGDQHIAVQTRSSYLSNSIVRKTDVKKKGFDAVYLVLFNFDLHF